MTPGYLFTSELSGKVKFELKLCDERMTVRGLVGEACQAGETARPKALKQELDEIFTEPKGRRNVRRIMGKGTGETTSRRCG